MNELTNRIVMVNGHFTTVTSLIENHFKEHSKRIAGYLRFRTKTEWNAEDVTQEAYTRAVRYADSYNGTNFDAWFNRILVNALKDFYREENGRMVEEFKEEHEEGTECPAYSEEVMRQVFELIGTKSENQIEVLTLYFKYGYTAMDISQLTPNTYAAAHQIIQRFRNELKDLYG